MPEPLLSLARRVLCLLACADRSQAEAAKLLGIGERTLGDLLRECGVVRRRKVPADPRDVARLITFLGGTPPDETAEEVANLRIQHAEQLRELRHQHNRKTSELRQRSLANERWLEGRIKRLMHVNDRLKTGLDALTARPCTDPRPWNQLTPYERQQRLEATYAHEAGPTR